MKTEVVIRENKPLMVYRSRQVNKRSVEDEVDTDTDDEGPGLANRLAKRKLYTGIPGLHDKHTMEEHRAHDTSMKFNKYEYEGKSMPEDVTADGRKAMINPSIPRGMEKGKRQIIEFELEEGKIKTEKRCNKVEETKSEILGVGLDERRGEIITFNLPKFKKPKRSSGRRDSEENETEFNTIEPREIIEVELDEGKLKTEKRGWGAAEVKRQIIEFELEEGKLKTEKAKKRRRVGEENIKKTIEEAKLHIKAPRDKDYYVDRADAIMGAQRETNTRGKKNKKELAARGRRDAEETGTEIEPRSSPRRDSEDNKTEFRRDVKGPAAKHVNGAKLLIESQMAKAKPNAQQLGSSTVAKVQRLKPKFTTDEQEKIERRSSPRRDSEDNETEIVGRSNTPSQDIKTAPLATRMIARMVAGDSNAPDTVILDNNASAEVIPAVDLTLVAGDAPNVREGSTEAPKNEKVDAFKGIDSTIKGFFNWKKYAFWPFYDDAKPLSQEERIARLEKELEMAKFEGLTDDEKVEAGHFVSGNV